MYVAAISMDTILGFSCDTASNVPFVMRSNSTEFILPRLFASEVAAVSALNEFRASDNREIVPDDEDETDYAVYDVQEYVLILRTVFLDSGNGFRVAMAFLMGWEQSAIAYQNADDEKRGVTA